MYVTWYLFQNIVKLSVSKILFVNELTMLFKIQTTAMYVSSPSGRFTQLRVETLEEAFLFYLKMSLILFTSKRYASPPPMLSTVHF